MRSASISLVSRVAVLPERERGVSSPPRLQLSPATVDDLVDTLRALADPTRLQIVLALRDATEPVCICDFTAAFELAQPTVSHHMARLVDAGLVESGKAGVWCFYRLRRDLPARVRRLIDSLA